MLPIILVCLLLFAFPTKIVASPFLVCDPTSEPVTKYEIDINGAVEEATLEQLGEQVRIKHDWADFPDGPYTVRARAGNMWGWTDWSGPFDFAKAVPTDASTAGLGIEE